MQKKKWSETQKQVKNYQNSSREKKINKTTQFEKCGGDIKCLTCVSVTRGWQEGERIGQKK